MARAGLLSVMSVVVASAAACALVIACGDEVGAIASPDAGSGENADGSIPGEDAGSEPADAGEDGEVIGDGGSNIDLDAGGDDAGPDAAACNSVANNAPAIMSACVSLAPVLGGGPLVAGTYHLAAVAALGQPAFCQNQFMPVSFKQTMELTVDANGVGTANTIGQLAALPPGTRTSTLDPGPNNASPMAATSTCPPRAGGKVAYFSGLRQATQVVVMRLAYGNGEALYRYDKQ